MFNNGLNHQFQFGDLPTGLTPMPLVDEDEDFLSMLQSTTKPANIAPTMTTANPADLTSNAALRNINLSPESTESSPSPPNHDTNSAQNVFNLYQTQSNMASRSTRSATRDPYTGESSSKRKQLDDLDEESDEDAPQRKQQHTDGSSSKKGATKRKSVTGQDDTRLQKRKEQNRAAQRAFRERKERHVKDLEDKVSILEEKTDTQAAENENLRELLTRLQQENLQLKQNQFNFTFQQPLASTSTSANTTAFPPKSSTDVNMTGVRPTSNTSSSNTQSPVNEAPLTRMASNSSSSGNLATLNNNRQNASTPQLTNNSSTPSDQLNLLDTFGISPSPDVNFAQSSTLTGLTPPSGSFTMMDNAFFGNTPPAGSSGGLNDLGFSSSFGDFPSSFAPMPYQTIASNNMFTSFRDPTENPNAWASFGPNPSQSQSLKNTYDELFGAGTSLSGNDDLTMSSLGGIGSSDELMPFSFLPDLSNGAGGSQFGGLSPISHLPTPPSASSAAGGQQSTFAGTPVSQQDHDMAVAQPQSSSTSVASKHDDSWMLGDDGKRCPRTKEEVESVMAKVGSGTFGPKPGEEDGEACATKMADATKLNLDIGTAWRAVRQHPQFEECDIDELCAELAQKATCDGTNKVIEAQKIMDIVHSIPERAKQRKQSLASRPSA